VTDASEASILKDIGEHLMGGPIESAAVTDPDLPAVQYDFEGDFQQRIVALMMRDPKFMRRTEGLVRPEYMDSEPMSFLVDITNSYFEKYRRIPRGKAIVTELFKDAFAAKRIRDELKREIINAYKDVNKVTLEDGDFIADKVGEFSRRQAVIQAYFRSQSMIDKGDLDGAQKLMKKAFDTGILDNFEEIDYWNGIDARTQYRKDKAAGLIKPTGITTGIPRLDKMLYHNGWGRKELSCLLGGAKKGKCVTRDTLLLTEHGMVEIGDYVPRNLPVDTFSPFKLKLLGRNGMEYTSDIYNNGKSETFKVVTRRGLEIEGTDNHPMLVADQNGDLVWRHLGEVQPGEFMAVQRGKKVFGSSVDLGYAVDAAQGRLAKDVTLPETMTPDLAEFIGMVIAEGHFAERSGQIVFTQKDEKIADRYRSLVKSLFGLMTYEPEKRNGCFDLRIESVLIRRYLEALGVDWVTSKHKTMPLAIRTAPEPCVRIFMASLIGLECHARKWSSSKVEIDLCMASEKLIRQLQVMLVNYGVVASRTKKRSCATNGTRIMRDYWRLKISGASNIKALQSIGLYEDRKNEILYGVELNAGTERDWVPNARAKIGGVIKEIKASGYGYKGILGESLARSLRCIRSGREGEVRQLTYSLARQLVQKLNEYGITGEGCHWLRETVTLNYAFEAIESVSTGYAETVDFTVPETHSFFANGLISHNSMGLGFFAVNASKAGYNTLYITMEVAGEIIADRNDANVSGTDMDALEAKMHAVQEAVDRESKRPGRGELRIVSVPAGTLTPAGLRRILERYRADGIVFDLIVPDYADIMAPDNYTDNAQENSKQVWLGLRAIAHEEDCAVLTATQSNRDGFKKDTTKAEDVAEDFNKVRIADLMMSINRSDDETAAGEARLFLAASRNQAGELTIKITQDLSKMQFIKGITGFS
jgi:intein/homing endonuclease